jgi:hypothetical protein
MSVKNGNANIARVYRTKYPDMPTLKLARIMYKENNLSFKDVESARCSLRYIEGKIARGNNVKKVTESQFYKTEDRPKNPYNLPASDETAFEPYVIKGHKKVTIFSDIHVPYHSIDAITAALQYAKKSKPDALLLN